MARKTHLPRARRAIAFRGDPRIGAAQGAPTAPHATARGAADDARAGAGRAGTSGTSGPARFWAGRRARVVGNVALALSVVLHLLVSPWTLLPDGAGIQAKDVDDELTIPVDLLGEEAPPPEAPPPEPVAEPEPEPDDPNGLTARADAGPPPKPEKEKDAGAPEPVATAEVDAGLVTIESDGGAPELDGGDGTADAGELDGGGDAGLVAEVDAGAPAGASGPRDPGSMIGMAGLVTAGKVNVTLLVNVAVIRTHPVGTRLGPLLYGIRQWNDFMQGSQTLVDPIRDTDWILIYGPSLIDTERDAILVRYSTSDEIVDQAVDAIARRYDQGGPFDAGVPGVRASLGRADGAERVFLRAQPHVLAVVPKDKAADFAKVLRRAPVSPKVRPGEAMRLTVKDPWRQISIPGLKFPNSLKELRLWIVPRAADGGADVHVEGDATDAEAAIDVADALNALIRSQNTLGMRLATRGLLNNARVVSEGDHVKMNLSVSRDQLEALLGAVGAFLGVQVQPPP